jgi:hypothetical protein
LYTRIMRVAFVRTAGEKDRVYVTRSDGSEVSWAFPSYGEAGLPHDLVHLIVETHLGVRGGFWERVDAGVDPSRIGAGGGLAAYGQMGDLERLLDAEALANIPWFVGGMTDEERAASCTRVPVTAAQVGELRARLEALRGEWRALGAKGALRYEVTAAGTRRA